MDNLVLNLGARYENVSPPKERNDLVDYGFETSSYVDPRLGFAYTPDWDGNRFLRAITGGNGKFSIRGGFGIFHGRVFQSVFSQGGASIRYNPPNAATIAQSSTNLADPLNGFVFTPGPGRARRRDVCRSGPEDAGIAAVEPDLRAAGLLELALPRQLHRHPRQESSAVSLVERSGGAGSARHSRSDVGRRAGLAVRRDRPASTTQRDLSERGADRCRTKSAFACRARMSGVRIALHRRTHRLEPRRELVPRRPARVGDGRVSRLHRPHDVHVRQSDSTPAPRRPIQWRRGCRRRHFFRRARGRTTTPRGPSRFDVAPPLHDEQRVLVALAEESERLARFRARRLDAVHGHPVRERHAVHDRRQRRTGHSFPRRRHETAIGRSASIRSTAAEGSPARPTTAACRSARSATRVYGDTLESFIGRNTYRTRTARRASTPACTRPSQFPANPAFMIRFDVFNVFNQVRWWYSQRHQYTGARSARDPDGVWRNGQRRHGADVVDAAADVATRLPP